MPDQVRHDGVGYLVLRLILFKPKINVDIYLCVLCALSAAGGEIVLALSGAADQKIGIYPIMIAGMHTMDDFLHDDPAGLDCDLS